jgi:hypothetical protein
MDTVTNKRLIVEFSGWVECNPEETWFQYIGSDPFEGVMGGDVRITGKEYITLSPEQQGDFMLESLGEAIQYSVDGEFCDINLEVEEPI